MQVSQSWGTDSELSNGNPYQTTKHVQSNENHQQGQARGRRIAKRRKWNESSQCELLSDPLFQDICVSFSLKRLAGNDTCSFETSHKELHSEILKALTQFVPFTHLGKFQPEDFWTRPKKCSNFFSYEATIASWALQRNTILWRRKQEVTSLASEQLALHQSWVHCI